MTVTPPPQGEDNGCCGLRMLDDPTETAAAVPPTEYRGLLPRDDDEHLQKRVSGIKKRRISVGGSAALRWAARPAQVTNNYADGGSRGQDQHAHYSVRLQIHFPLTLSGAAMAGMDCRMDCRKMVGGHVEIAITSTLLHLRNCSQGRSIQRCFPYPPSLTRLSSSSSIDADRHHRQRGPFVFFFCHYCSKTRQNADQSLFVWTKAPKLILIITPS